MNNETLNKSIVLSLNRNWLPIDQRTVREAIVAMTGGSKGIPPALGLDIEYEKNEDGSWNRDQIKYVNPVNWDQWVQLAVREFDMSIRTPRQLIRVPTVTVAPNYKDMRMVNPSFSREAVFMRDGGVCQFSGEHVGWEGGNLDHVVAQSKGGKDEWENVVWSKIGINSMKADRDMHEVGLNLIRPPKAPKPVPVSATFRHARHNDWKHFLVTR